MKNPHDLVKVINDLVAVKREYSLLAFDEEHPMKLGEPAKVKQIAKVEKRLGKPLPPTYRAFLELHNGWEYFDGDLNLLSAEDQDSEWVKAWLKMLSMAFLAIKEENPFEKGGIPIMLGEGEHRFLILDPRTIRSDGEMDFIKFHFAEIEERFSDFASFLQQDLRVEKQLLKKEKKGASDDEADDED